MPIKITCPHCGHAHRFSAPYPLPGSEVQCSCGLVLVVSFPPDLVTKLRAKGAAFEDTLDPDAGARASGHYLPSPTPAVPRTPSPAPQPPASRPAGADSPGDPS